ncbi:MAG: IS1 family transposase [Candidatus Bathyarchaeum sp.]|nr:MAG: IS1 family transposase [Candidatus Bathyarchaeum sp.]
MNMNETKKNECPECKSNNTAKHGFMVTRQGRKQRFQCKACGLTFTEKLGKTK